MKTIVSIVSEQTVPNYLFIKEMMEQDDELLFVTSNNMKMKEKINFIVAVAKIEAERTKTMILENEKDFSSMCEQIVKEIDPQKSYAVNLTGGTKWMSMAVKQAFDNSGAKNVEMYYIPFPDNKILKLNTGNEMDINYRLKVREYIELHGLTCSNPTNKGCHYAEKSKEFFEQFIKDDKTFIENVRLLRECQNQNPIKNNLDKGKKMTFADLFENNKEEVIRENSERLKEFVRQIWGDTVQEIGKEQLRFITGGWFEYFIYDLVNERVANDDVVCGLNIWRQIEGKKEGRNELDIVYMHDNRMYIIECKTGGIGGKDGVPVSSIVYKGETIRKRLGLANNFVIVNASRIKNNNVENEMRTNKELYGIRYFDREKIRNGELVRELNSI